ncbi:gamma-glutamyltransferase [Nocardioides dongxiaopingii]|uniref:gamma-glutamyltransferase n=1 Tax=Nocardioides sp. S-1144 TaxID=2582905 RepID=UPI001162B512|nr:gamma-glutamyltransferase [Nocardioides sp. S-1144]QCW51536.2 gamma-glutamyltransferase [Nocardioides sp. S-1144]
MRRPLRPLAAVVALSLAPALLVVAPGSAAPRPGVAAGAAPGAAPSAVAERDPQVPKQATATGRGGGVTSVDPDATRIGLRILRRGGNAVDAAVATAAALGVTEPYSAGVGGGGFFVFHDARTGKTRTIDGRETAPGAIPRDAFVDPATGEPYPFTPDLVTSGVSVGVPGTPATWTTALERWGTRSLSQVLVPSARLAERGFVVDPTFRSQTDDNRERFAAFTTTRKLFLRGGKLPKVGSRFRNPDLAATYRAFARNPDLFYRGSVPREISRTVRTPPTTRVTDLPVPKGYLRPGDFRRYEAEVQAPTRSRYRGYQVIGMAPSSSGGTTVGEALNIMKGYRLRGMSRAQALHHYLEAGALAFADRGAYVGDGAFVDVPVDDLLSQEFADERACGIDPAQAAPKPVPAGDVDDYDGDCATAAPRPTSLEDHENISTTHLTVSDRWGNVVAYTLTIEQTGGSGIVVPGRGFLLNNELTDFSLTYDPADPNRLEPGKRPRSSMAPTILLRDGKPFLALGSPGGSTIITTVLQILHNRIDRGMTLPQAVRAPRASPRNSATVSAEPLFLERFESVLEALGHDLVPAGDAFTSAAEIGAATAIEFGPEGRIKVVAEPVRRGGGAAGVVSPR